MKIDARVRYTKNIIQKVFLCLLSDKAISKITVKEICEKAEINRGTFYKHYQDVYDLMQQLEEEALDRFEQLLFSTTENGSGPVLVTLLQSLADNKNLITPLMDNTTSDDFMNRLTDRCTKYALSHLNSSDFLDNPQKQYTYSYLVGGTSKLIEYWLKTGSKESPQAIAEAIQSLNDTILLDN